MNVIAYDAYPAQNSDINYVDLEYLFKNSDIMFQFFPDGKLECDLSSSFYNERKVVGSYSLKGNKLTMSLEKELLEGECFFNQKGILLVAYIHGLLLPFQMLEVR
jgi:hypothetical protein